MVRSPAEVIALAWSAWGRRDKSTTLSLFADDAIYSLYIPEEVLPFGGTTRGKPSISDRLQPILDQFETELYEPRLTNIDGERVHGVVHFRFRHKLTREPIEGMMRHVAVIRDGLIVELSEYHDAAKIRAFMRLVSHAAAQDTRC